MCYSDFAVGSSLSGGGGGRLMRNVAVMEIKVLE